MNAECGIKEPECGTWKSEMSSYGLRGSCLALLVTRNPVDGPGAVTDLTFPPLFLFEIILERLKLSRSPKTPLFTSRYFNQEIKKQ